MKRIITIPNNYPSERLSIATGYALANPKDDLTDIANNHKVDLNNSILEVEKLKGTTNVR